MEQWLRGFKVTEELMYKKLADIKPDHYLANNDMAAVGAMLAFSKPWATKSLEEVSGIVDSVIGSFLLHYWAQALLSVSQTGNF